MTAPESPRNDKKAISSSVLSILTSVAGSVTDTKPQIGVKQFAHYTLTRSIGRGGFGEVFLAFQNATWKPIAIKVLSKRLRSDAKVRSRFELEIRVGKELKHPHILPVIDDGEVGGIRYFAAPFIEGEDLLHRLAKKPMPVQDAVRILRQVAEAVSAAHAHGYLHRDIKPANILIEAKTGNPFVADFGLAKEVAASSPNTETLAVLGTQAYMPPEQADPNLGEFSAATDIYALGVTLYQSLTGRTPFPSKDKPNRDILLQIAWDRPAPPSTFNTQIPADLDRICLVCLQKSPYDRYESAAELAADLERFEAGKPIRAKLPGIGKRLYRSCRRHPRMAIALAASICLAVTGGLLAKAYATDAKTAKSGERAAKESERVQTYVTDMRDGQVYWQKGERDALKRVLDKYATDDRKSLRNLEWYYWNKRLGGTGQYTDLSFSPESVVLSMDGSHVAVAGENQLAVFDTSSMTQRFSTVINQNMQGERVSDCTIAFDSTGRMVSVASGYLEPVKGELTIWDAATGTRRLSIADKDVNGGCLTFSPDGNSVLASVKGGNWRAWSTIAGQPQGQGLIMRRPRRRERELWELETAGIRPIALRFLQSSMLAMSLPDSTFIWDWPAARDAAETVGVQHVLGGWPELIEQAPSVIVVSSGSHTTAQLIPAQYELDRNETGLNGEGSATVVKYALSDTTRTMIPQAENLLVTPFAFVAVDFTPGWMAAACRDGAVRVWSLDRRWNAVGVPEEYRDKEIERMRAVSVRNGQVAAVGARRLWLWSVHRDPGEDNLHDTETDDRRVFGAFSPSGNLVANPAFRIRGSTRLQIRSTRDDALVAAIDLGVGTPSDCVISDDDRYLFMQVANQVVLPRNRVDRKRPMRREIWEINGPRLVLSLPQSESPGAQAPHSRLFQPFQSRSTTFDTLRSKAYFVDGNRVDQVDLGSGKVSDLFTHAGVHGMAISPTGKLLAIAGTECGVFDLAERRWLWKAGVPSTRVVFHRDEKYLIVQTMSAKLSILALDCRTGSAVPTLFQNESLSQLVFSRDERRLFSLSKNGLRMYSIDENPGTLLIDDPDFQFEEGTEPEQLFVRNLESQITGVVSKPPR